MFTLLPRDPLIFVHWDWSRLKPYADDLLNRSITPASLNDWMVDWSDLCRLVGEIYARLWDATTRYTADQTVKNRFNEFLDNTYIPWQAANQQLKQKLLGCSLQPEGFDVPLRNIRIESEIYNDENLPLIVEEKKLVNEYEEILGAQAVEWEGKEITTTQLQPVYLSLDREKREKAWRLETARKLADRQKLNDLWSKLLTIRFQVAEHAGFDDYRLFRWKELLRFDYTPEDCLEFHKAVEQVAVPAARRMYEKRQNQLGVTSLRPWDLFVNPAGRAPLKPFGTANELEEKISTIFHKINPELGGYFEIMRRKGLLDLENRKDKAPGAYCNDYDMVMLPFIFENAVGIHADVSTLLHEGGHAFHIFEEAHLPYYHQLQVGMEFAEIASSAMELFAFPYLVKSEGGFYSEEDAARACIEHLEEAVLFWPYMAVVDAFQHWAYTHQDAAMNPKHCDQKWAELWQQYMVGVDCSGLDDWVVTGWQRKQHIFEAPFYYIEYGMAYVGAFQVWANAMKDQQAAVAAYRRALALGGTVPLPVLYETAGAKFKFDSETLQATIDLIVGMIAKLEQV